MEVAREPHRISKSLRTGVGEAHELRLQSVIKTVELFNYLNLRPQCSIEPRPTWSCTTFIGVNEYHTRVYAGWSIDKKTNAMSMYNNARTRTSYLLRQECRCPWSRQWWRENSTSEVGVEVLFWSTGVSDGAQSSGLEALKCLAPFLSIAWAPPNSQCRRNCGINLPPQGISAARRVTGSVEDLRWIEEAN